MLDYLLEVPEDTPFPQKECPNCMIEMIYDESQPQFSCLLCKECFDIEEPDFDFCWEDAYGY